MSKVINIVTKLEETELPFKDNSAEEILAYLFEYKSTKRSQMAYSEHIIMRDLIKFIENNSGVNVAKMVEARSAK